MLVSIIGLNLCNYSKFVSNILVLIFLLFVCDCTAIGFLNVLHKCIIVQTEATMDNIWQNMQGPETIDRFIKKRYSFTSLKNTKFKTTFESFDK